MKTSSEMLGHVIWYKRTDVAKVPAARTTRTSTEKMSIAKTWFGFCLTATKGNMPEDRNLQLTLFICGLFYDDVNMSAYVMWND
jgi:hypothetical protein